MIAVDSSLIDSVGYDPDTSELHISFTNPKPVTYAYYIVERRIFDHFLHAQSKGRFFNDFVKGRYPYRQVS